MRILITDIELSLVRTRNPLRAFPIALLGLGMIGLGVFMIVFFALGTFKTKSLAVMFLVNVIIGLVSLFPLAIGTVTLLGAYGVGFVESSKVLLRGEPCFTERDKGLFGTTVRQIPLSKFSHIEVVWLEVDDYRHSNVSRIRLVPFKEDEKPYDFPICYGFEDLDECASLISQYTGLEIKRAV